METVNLKKARLVFLPLVRRSRAVFRGVFVLLFFLNGGELGRRLSCSEAGTKANFLSACHLLCQSTLED